MKILDCGAGRGVLQFYLSSKNYNIFSIDISHNRSKQVVKFKKFLKKFGIKFKIDPQHVHKKLNKKYKTNVIFELESASELTFPDNYFDRVFCISVIEHMEDDIIAKSIQEMERVLKPGGLVLLTFDYHLSVNHDIIGFTESDFKTKVMDQCNLEIVGNEPNYKVENWDQYLAQVNKCFGNVNPNTSFGVVLKKNE